MASKAMYAISSREVVVNREKLLDALQSNKEKHLREYLEAVQGYKDEAMKKLEEDGKEAKRKLEKNLRYVADEIQQFSPETADRFNDQFVIVQQVTLSMPVPRSYEDAYNTAIELAKWEVSDTMKLTYAEFRCFVMDQWDWKDDFEAVSMRYMKKV